MLALVVLSGTCAKRRPIHGAESRAVQMYKGMFKCRLCGAVYENSVTGTKKVAMREVETVIIRNAPEMTVHFCKNGSFGISDFLGFANDSSDKRRGD